MENIYLSIKKGYNHYENKDFNNTVFVLDCFSFTLVYKFKLYVFINCTEDGSFSEKLMLIMILEYFNQ